MTKKITTFFTDNGAPKTGLSATIRIRNLATNALVVTNAAMTEVGDGFYSYDFTSYDEDDEYAIRCDGSATLTSDGERYTYAGNESYVEDIWDAQVVDHQVPGSMGYEIRGAGGVIVGNHHGAAGRAITQEEAMAIAQKVWEVMLTNDKNAKEVLLSRSTFNSILDTVVLKDPIEIPNHDNDFERVISEVKNMTKSITAIAEKPIAPVSIPDTLLSSIQDILKSVEECISGSTEKMAEAVSGASDTFVSAGSELSSKIDSLSGQMENTNLDLSQAGELAAAFTTLKDSLTTLMMLTDKMSGDTESRRALKKTMLQLNSIKFNMLESRLK